MPSRAQYISYLQTPQAKAALDTIAWAEGGTYNKLFGGGTFTGNQHPNIAVSKSGYTSTAAGRYQFLYRTWIEIKNRLGLPDFSSQNQDIAALDLINQRGQLNKLLNGDFEGMLRGLGCAWAALPFSGCGQPQRSLTNTLNYYNGALRVYGTQQPINTNPSQVINIPQGANTDDQEEQDKTLLYVIGGLVLLALIV